MIGPTGRSVRMPPISSVWKNSSSWKKTVVGGISPSAELQAPSRSPTLPPCRMISSASRGTCTTRNAVPAFVASASARSRFPQPGSPINISPLGGWVPQCS